MLTILVVIPRDADHQCLILCALRNRCDLSSNREGVGGLWSLAWWREDRKEMVTLRGGGGGGRKGSLGGGEWGLGGEGDGVGPEGNGRGKRLLGRDGRAK